ncbi:putative growth-regulating factor [Helianthus annuus]|nr:putative growth-regulating factor [Helianthus annuus]
MVIAVGGVWEGSSFPYNQLYQIGGYGRNIDLEPGRCRRTDGKNEGALKKLTLIQNTVRGRNRSRKPVEFSSSSSAATSVNNVSSSAISKSVNAYPPPFSSFMDSSSFKDYRFFFLSCLILFIFN